MRERFHLFLNVGNDAMSDLTATLDLNDEKRLARLNQQVDLAALCPFRRLLQIRRGGEDERPFDAEFGEKQIDMVEDEVFKLKSENALPSFKLFQRGEFEKSVGNRLFLRFDEVQVKANVIVLDPIRRLPHRFAGLRIEPCVIGDKSRQHEFLQRLGVSPVRVPSLGSRQFSRRFRPGGEKAKKSSPTLDLGTEDTVERLIEIAIEKSVWQEAESADIFI